MIRFAPLVVFMTHVSMYSVQSLAGSVKHSRQSRNRGRMLRASLYISLTYHYV